MQFESRLSAVHAIAQSFHLCGRCKDIAKINLNMLVSVQNQFDSIDLSDNAIMILEGFPQLPRLKTLYLNNNRILRIGRNLEGELLGHTD